MRRVSKEASVPPSSRRRAKLALGAFAMLLATLAIGVGIAVATAPLVTIDPPTSATYTSVDVSGTVDPQDEETLYFFQYSTDDSSWETSPVAEWLSPGAGPTNVSGTINGLEPGTEYFIRLVASNASGEEVFSDPPDPSLSTLAVAKPTVSLDPVSAVTDSSAHFSGTVNPNGADSPFDTSWHFICTPACPDLQAGEIQADGSSHDVSVDAANLEPNSDYEVALAANNLGGQEIDGPLSFHTGRAAPGVATQAAEGAVGDSATLAGYVTPRNSVTRYQFEWGTSAAYGNLAPGSPAAVGAVDNLRHRVTVPLAGLQQGTTYHYRLRATNTETSQVTVGADQHFTVAATPGPCPNATTRSEQNASRLPDCRAYEQVTPVGKNGLNAEVAGSQVAADGNGVGYTTGPSQSLLDDEQGNRRSVYRSERTSSGWTTASLMPPTTFSVPSSFNGAPSVAAFSADLSTATLSTPDAWDSGDTNSGQNNLDLYRRNSDGSLTWLSRGSGNQGTGAKFMQETPDGRWVYFGDREQLNPSQPVPPGAGQRTPYLYRSDGGTPELLGILPDGSVDDHGSVLGGTMRVAGGGEGFGKVDGVHHNAVSPDQRYVVFSSSVTEAHFELASNQLYVRDLKSGVTTLISKSPGPGGEPADAPVDYEGAAWGPAGSSGGTIFFSTRSDLLGGHAGGGIYSYDIGSGQLEFLVEGAFVGNAEGSDCFNSTRSCSGVITVSDDGSRIYFASFKALDGPSGAGQDQNEDGRANLYVYDTDDRTVTFIAKLDPGNGFEYGVGQPDARLGGILASILQVFGEATQQAQASAGDGHVLIFQTRSRLTSYDNSSSACEQARDAEHTTPGVERCFEIYRYDADTDSLECLTCRGGSPNDSWIGIPQAEPNGLNFVSNMYSAPANAISADGSRVFFNSRQALVSSDTDGTDDGYAWSDGSLATLASGSGSDASYFVNSDDSGRNAFVGTLDRLTRSDTDSLYDLYDVRVDGGFDETQQGRCGGDQCRGPLAVPPATATPATSTFSGSGNQPQKHVKKKSPRKHHKKHAKKRHGKKKAGKAAGNKRSGK